MSEREAMVAEISRALQESAHKNEMAAEKFSGLCASLATALDNLLAKIDPLNKGYSIERRLLDEAYKKLAEH